MWDYILTLMKGKTTLLYGEAGSGKTNIALQATQLLCRDESRKCFFISCEGLGFTKVLHRYFFGSNTFFGEAVSLDHLLDMLLGLKDTYPCGEVGVVSIDTINGHYYDFSGSSKHNTLLNLILGTLNYLSSECGTSVLITARVKEEAADYKPIAQSPLYMFSDNVVRLTKLCGGIGKLIIESSSNTGALQKELGYVIGENGVELGREPRIRYC